jgi:type II secretory pathway predicted ATPase ExeA/outer membrane protein OmpA-like peptidoglycan-associated protein
MYLSFYRFKHKPFQISTDPKFLWLGEKHQEALATLRYGVLDNKGFLLLTGDVGTGKTTLINALLNSLDKNTYVASIRDPALEPMDFFIYVAHAFGLNTSKITSKGAFLILFEKFLADAYQENRKVLLIIDESQRMGQTLLEEVRLLSNIENEESKLINIFFIGQIEFNETLLRPENKALCQRITTHYNIEVLSEEETAHYIQHRLDVAFSQESTQSFAPVQRIEQGVCVHQPFRVPLPQEKLVIFPPESVREIYAFSKGYPRLINIICDRALLTGYVEGFRTINPRQIRECARELEIVNHKSLPLEAAKESTTDVKPEKRTGGGAPKDWGAVESQPVAEISRKTNSVDDIQPQSEKSSTSSRAQLVPDPEIAGTSERQKQENSYPIPNQTFRLHETEDEDQYDISLVNTRVMIAELKKHLNSAEDITSGVAVKDTVMPADLEEAEKSERKQTWKNRKMVLAGFLVLLLVGGYGYVNPEGAFLKFDSVSQFVRDSWERFERQSSVSSPQSEDSVETRAVSQNSSALERSADLTQAVPLNTVFIEFPPDSSLPDERSLQALDRLIVVATTNPSSFITVSYFSDNLENATIADIFSESRANTVKSYLMGKGVSSSRILVRKRGTMDKDAISAGQKGLTPADFALEVKVVL